MCILFLWKTNEFESMDCTRRQISSSCEEFTIILPQYYLVVVVVRITVVVVVVVVAVVVELSVKVKVKVDVEIKVCLTSTSTLTLTQTMESGCIASIERPRVQLLRIPRDRRQG